jgi:hypothetical protein
MNVVVFKTSVDDPLMVAALKPSLDQLAGAGHWNFDLTDCDKILRIASDAIEPNHAIALLKARGLYCVELDDVV